jgi:lysyl-tRNA synthetase class 2
MQIWRPEVFSRRYAHLKTRQKVIRAIRRYFDEQDFDEVETPILQTAPGCEVHLHAFSTELLSADRQKSETKWLHTSPEFAMKKLIVAGVEKQYQICHVFRNAEGSSRHSPEFTMIEWYRIGCDYWQIMDDCIGLVRNVATASGVDRLIYKELQCDPFAEAEYLTLDQAFRRYADIPLSELLGNRDGLAKAAIKAGARILPEDDWDAVYFSVLNDIIEPKLGVGRMTFLYEYPAHMAVLSRKKPGDERWAERFELYINGLELANAFSELTDVAEQRIRFGVDMAEKEKLYGHRWPIDEDFLDAMTHGMPACAGIALGVDRLVMLAAHTDEISDVLWLKI